MTARRGSRVTREYPGFSRGSLSPAVRSELLLAQIQRAMNHQFSWRRPWQRYEPLWAFLDPEIWPDDQSVVQDLSYAKLATEILTESQKCALDAALEDQRQT